VTNEQIANPQSKIRNSQSEIRNRYQHVGNWPGKTIEQKTGTYHHKGLTVHVVDLPSTYSLTANSLEERIARDYVVQEQPDVVVAIVDAASLERNLYLLAELLGLPVPVVLRLNMLDVAEQQGMHVEPHVSLYHLPNARTIGLSVWQRTVDFLKEAGSIILVVAVIVWAFSTLPGGQIETSCLATIGRLLTPLGALLGLDWQAALAFLTVQVLFIPCVATLVTIRQEIGSWRWTGFCVALLLIVSFALGITIYQGARLVGWGM